MKKRIAVALFAGGLLIGTTSPALAAPPNPIRQAAHLHEAECANPAGRFTHGAYVSFVARGYPTDPIHCSVIPPVGEE